MKLSPSRSFVGGFLLFLSIFFLAGHRTWGCKRLTVSERHVVRNSFQFRATHRSSGCLLSAFDYRTTSRMVCHHNIKKIKWDSFQRDRYEIFFSHLVNKWFTIRCNLRVCFRDRIIFQISVFFGGSVSIVSSPVNPAAALVQTKL